MNDIQPSVKKQRRRSKKFNINDLDGAAYASYMHRKDEIARDVHIGLFAATANEDTAVEKSEEGTDHHLKTHVDNKPFLNSPDVRITNRSELDAAKHHLRDYLVSIGHTPDHRGMLQCICPNHTDEEPSMKFNGDDNTVHCFGCGFHGDIVNVIAAHEGLKPNSKDAIDRAIEFAGGAPRGTERKRPSKSKDSVDFNQIRAEIKIRQGNFDEPACIKYLHQRGFTDDDLHTLKSLGVGFDTVKKTVVFPTGDWQDNGICSYSARYISPRGDHRYDNPKGYPATIFNIAAFNHNIIAVTEGAFDAAALNCLGIAAVGLPGVGNCHDDLLANVNTSNAIVIAFDNDSAGETAADNLAKKLDARGILHTRFVPPSPHKDCNDAFIADRHALKHAFDRAYTDLQHRLEHQRLLVSARSEPVSVLDTVALNLIDTAVNDKSTAAALVLDQPALIAAAQASDLNPIVFTLYRNFVKRYGVSLKSFDTQIKKYIEPKQTSSHSKIVAFNDSVNTHNLSHGVNLPPLPKDLNFDVSTIQVPNDFRIDTDGVWQFTKVGRGQWDWIKISNSALIIVSVEHNVDDDTFKSRVAGFSKGLGWRLTPDAIDDAVLASPQKIIDLARFGLDIHGANSKSIIKYLSDLKAVNATIIPHHKTVSRVGWRKDGSFVYPNLQNNSATLDGALRRQYGDLFATHGDPSKVDALLNQLRDNHSAMLIVGAALAAPAVHVLRSQNVAIHVYGRSGCGKSTLQKLALSLFIDPNEQGALPTADFTKAGAEGFFDSRHDLPAIIDDINSATDDRSRQAVSDLPYQFANRSGRLRGTKNGGNARLVDFRGSLITSGEKTLTTSQSSAGGKRRLIEHEMKNGLLSRELITDIHRIIAVNYGFHGRQFVDFLVANDVAPELQAEVRQRRQLRLREFYDVLRYGDDGFDIGNGLYVECKDKVPLHIDTVAAIAATLTVFFTRDGNGNDRNDLHNDELLHWARWALAILNDLPGENAISDMQRAADFIADWISSNPKSFADLNDKEQAFDPDSFTTFGFTRHIKDKDGDEHEQFCIIPTVVTTALDNAGFPADTVLRQLADSGFIDRPDRKNLKRLVKINGRPQRFLVFHSDRLFPKNIG